VTKPVSSSDPAGRAGRESGFTLIELLIAMVIVVEILVAAFTVFDVHNQMARIQAQITDVQQSLRVAQYDMVRTTRMAGRGGIPARFGAFVPGPNTWTTQPGAVEVRNNLIDDDDRDIATGFTGSPRAVPGTDVLIVRGCISGTLFQVDSATPGDFQPDTGTVGTADTGSLVLRRIANGREQNLSQLRDATFVANPAPLLIQSAVSRDQYAIAEVDGTIAGDADAVTIPLTWISQEDPPNPRVGISDLAMSASFVCALEEYRYFVRENFAIPGDDTSRLLPRLARARMIPFTELPHAGDAGNLALDLADEITDLQVALAFDTDFGGAFDNDTDALGDDDILIEGATDGERAADDWLFNSSEDDPTDTEYGTNAATLARMVKLISVRINTVGRTSRPDPDYVAPDIDPIVGADWVEDSDYDTAPADQWKTGINRNYRRRTLQTVVDMRNL
jgi:prepilin-type N-terminal cleavage/methylation domain-containing protein